MSPARAGECVAEHTHPPHAFRPCRPPQGGGDSPIFGGNPNCCIATSNDTAQGFSLTLAQHEMGERAGLRSRERPRKCAKSTDATRKLLNSHIRARWTLDRLDSTSADPSAVVQRSGSCGSSAAPTQRPTLTMSGRFCVSPLARLLLNGRLHVANAEVKWRCGRLRWKERPLYGQ